MSIKQKAQEWVNKKFIIVIRREIDFSVIRSFSVSKASGAVLLFVAFVVFFILGLVGANTFLKRWADPRFLETENALMLRELSLTVDSLLVEVDRKDRFIGGLRQIIVGQDPGGEEQEAEERKGGDAAPQRREVDLFEKNADTEAIIAEFREGIGPYTDRVEGIRTPGGETYFFAPLRGMVISAFNPGQQHFGVDILSKENEPVKAVTGGRVIFASWTLDTGYVIGVQHDGDLISFYKHNSVLLKKIGDAVTAGEPIAIIGGTGELSSGEHLHFELWYRGSPVNPQEFIKFD